MLQFIRSKAGSLIVKLLFAVLIFAFGAWGIGDIFRERTAAETTVATVGDIKIQADELQNAVRHEIERIRPMFGGNFDMEQAKQFGIVGTALDRIVSGDLMTLEERRLGLQLDDKVVNDAIFTNPAFRGPTGTFDRGVLNAILANNQMTEGRFFEGTRRDLLNAELAGAVIGGGVAPSVLAEQIYRTRNEKRVVDTVFIGDDKVAAPAAPSEQELQAFYDAHSTQFRAPEYRGFTALVMRPDDLAADITIPENKLREAYESRLSDFQTPERREVQQIIVGDADKAKEVETQLASGKDFATVAKEVANQDEEAVKPSWYTREDMHLPELADAAFALGKGETSQPIQSPFGWHILRVTDTDQGGTRPFEEVRQELTTTLAREAAADQLGKQANKVEDAIAGGASVEEIAQQFKVKPITVAAADVDGKAPDGAAVSLPDAQILQVVFATDKGQTSRLNETKDDGFFVVRVDSITPSAVRPLAEVADRAKELYLAEKRGAAAEEEAKAIAAAVSGGQSLGDAAQAKQLKVETSAPLGRTSSGAATLPPSVVARIFELKPDETAAVGGKGGWYVAQLKSIQKPEPASDKTALDTTTNQLGDNIRNDLLQQFDQALRRHFPVDVRQPEIDRLL